ncbi:MAG: hypothetical protein KIT45_05025 [Fimbriimonadia bacterium]|nr:hypothetical protein [Fimbriimonadia bacterium]
MTHQLAAQAVIAQLLEQSHRSISEAIGEPLPSPEWIDEESLVFILPLESRLIKAGIQFNRGANKIVVYAQLHAHSSHPSETSRFVVLVNNHMYCSALLFDEEQGILARDAIPMSANPIETLIHTERMLDALRNTLIALEAPLLSVISGEQSADDAITALKLNVVAHHVSQSLIDQINEIAGFEADNK